MRTENENFLNSIEKNEYLKKVLVPFFVFLSFCIGLYYFYAYQIGRERSYISGKVVSKVFVEKKGGSFFSCKARLDNGDEVDAICNSEVKEGSQVKVMKIQTLKNMFMYQVVENE